MAKAKLQSSAAKRHKRAALSSSPRRPPKTAAVPAGRRNSASPECEEIRLIPIRIENDIRPGDSIAEILLRATRQWRITFLLGDILVIKHKIVSKAEGRIIDLSTITASAESTTWAEHYKLDARVVELALRESRGIIRRKNGVLITETRQGFICANSGIDVSNVDGGRNAVLLPEDPDQSAGEIRRDLKKAIGLSIPVIISDSFGRPWREGLTEFAIGISGMKPLRDYRDQRDPHGYRLKASVEAVADELASAAGLMCGKLNRTPACVIRGFHCKSGVGGVRELLREPDTDLFR